MHVVIACTGDHPPRVLHGSRHRFLDEDVTAVLHAQNTELSMQVGRHQNVYDIGFLLLQHRCRVVESLCTAQLFREHVRPCAVPVCDTNDLTAGLLLHQRTVKLRDVPTTNYSYSHVTTFFLDHEYRAVELDIGGKMTNGARQLTSSA